MPSILDSSTSVLNQLGSTIGRGVTPAASGGAASPAVNNQAERDFYDRIADEEARNADRTYKLNRDKLDQDYKVAKLNAKTARERNEIDKWYNQQQVQLAQQRLAFDQDSFNKTHALNQAKLGYDVLNTAANMRGADNYFQASNYMRGVANDPNSATFLTALKNNVNLPSFVAPSGSPDAFTLNSLSSKLGTPLGESQSGSGASSGNADDAYLSQIHALGAAGAHKLGAGSLEQLSNDELKLLQSGLEAPGADGKAFNFSDFMHQYKNSRIGQSASGGGYAAA